MKPKPRDIRTLRMIHKDELTRQERRILKKWRQKHQIWNGAEVLERLEANFKRESN